MGTGELSDRDGITSVCRKLSDSWLVLIPYTVYSGYSGHVYSGRSDIVATFPGTKSIYSIIFRSDIVTNQI